MNMMKYILSLISIVLIVHMGLAQNSPEAHPGKNAVFIYCGNELPKNFRYRISRREAAGNEWQEMAVLSFPSGLTSWNGRMFRETMNNTENDIPDSTVMAMLWQKLKISNSADSLYSWSAFPFMLSACGTGWWDRSVEAGRRYRYRVEKISGGKVIGSATTGNVSVPGEAPQFIIRPDSISGNGTSVVLGFNLIRYKGMSGCHVFRGYFRRGNFERIHPLVMYNSINGKKHMFIIDKSVMEKAQYSYYIVPHDIYGNESMPSDTINVYNTKVNNIPDLVMNFKAESLVNDNAMKLTWQLSNTEGIVSIDIYKAVTYNGFYTRIGTVSADDKEFLDHNVQPVTTYYYTLVLNMAYGKTFPSARFPAIYKGIKKNPFPPAGLTAVRQGNVVKLSWTRTGMDIRGYYLYRSDGFTRPMQPVTGIILNPDSVVSYTDSLNVMPQSPVIVYAVASENTSYSVSPLSDRVSVSGDFPALPIPTNLNAVYRDNQVELYWDNLSLKNHLITGYRIFRRTENDHGETVSSNKRINNNLTGYGINSYTDTTVQEGFHYFYTVESVGLDSENVSAPSLEAGVIIPLQLPLAPGQLRLMNTTGGVLVQWTTPMDNSIKNIRILRAEKGGSMKPVITLDPGTSEWVDKNVSPDKVYFYQAVSVDAKGRQSKPDEPLGIRTAEGR